VAAGGEGLAWSTKSGWSEKSTKCRK